MSNYLDHLLLLLSVLEYRPGERLLEMANQQQQQQQQAGVPVQKAKLDAEVCVAPVIMNISGKLGH